MKNQLTLANNSHAMLKKFAIAALVIALIVSLAAVAGINPAFAAGGAGGDPDDVLGGVVNVVLDIITMAARYIGLIIVLWGFFQIVLAMRREDSEGISKQVTTIVVGGVLCGFSFVINPLKTVLGI
jgi:uncharacterized membrane protein